MQHSVKSYEEEASFNITRDEFLRQLDEAGRLPADGTSAERLYAAYQAQLADGTLDVYEEAGERRARFRVPITHFIAPYLVPQLVDAIEGAHALCLRAYRLLLSAESRAWLEVALDVVDRYRAIEVLIGLLLGAVLLERWRGRRREEAAPVRRKEE